MRKPAGIALDWSDDATIVQSPASSSRGGATQLYAWALSGLQLWMSRLHPYQR